MLTYLYDGSFDGLLCALDAGITRQEKPEEIVSVNKFHPSLFSVSCTIRTDTTKASHMSATIRRKISPGSLENIYHGYLSEMDHCEQAIFEYAELGFALGAAVDDHLTDERVNKVHRLAQKVLFEKHRLIGLLRFQQLRGDVFYAQCEPDHNVLPLLAPHFSERLANERWIIHDLKRKTAIFFDTKEWVVSPLTVEDLPFWSKKEAQYQGLWREFVRSVAIDYRISEKRQARCMPRRYWKHLTEKRDDLP